SRVAHRLDWSTAKREDMGRVFAPSRLDDGLRDTVHAHHSITLTSLHCATFLGFHIDHCVLRDNKDRVGATPANAVPISLPTPVPRESSTPLVGILVEALGDRPPLPAAE